MSLERAQALLRDARRIAVLTGAGISVASGLRAFRGPEGLWEGHDPSALATPEAFASDPELVWRFYGARVAALAAAEPNEAHRALAALADAPHSDGAPRSVTVATQNIDGLHQRAGSRGVLELHGSLRRARCTACDARAALAPPLPEPPALPRCPVCGDLLRPDVVWFGEPLPRRAFERAVEAFADCELALVVGTSGAVMPAAGLAGVAHHSGASVVEVNPDAASIGSSGWTSIADRAEVVLPRLVASAGTGG